MYGLLTRALSMLLLVALGVAIWFWKFASENPIWASLIVAWCVLYVALGVRQDQIAARSLIDARMRDEIVPAMSPIEYEQFVTRLLARAGWNARHCGKQGDQGCDVKAELRGFRAVVQVKHYRGRCPNIAVQEAVGARLHYAAQIMVVVAPNGFTRSAMELARSNGVHLLHHSQLGTLERIARIP